MSQTSGTSPSTQERDTEFGGLTAEEVYEEHKEYLPEFAERDDALGAAARSVIRIVEEDDTDE